MIKIDTSKNDNGQVELVIQGNPIELAHEALAIMGCLKAGIRDIRKGEQGELDALIFEAFFLQGLQHAMDAPADIIKHTTKESEDVRSADFTSEEEFRKWFRGE